MGALSQKYLFVFLNGSSIVWQALIHHFDILRLCLRLKAGNALRWVAKLVRIVRLGGVHSGGFLDGTRAHLTRAILVDVTSRGGAGAGTIVRVFGRADVFFGVVNMEVLAERGLVLVDSVTKIALEARLGRLVLLHMLRQV